MTATADTTRERAPQLPAGKDGFAQVLAAEWTKFRSMRSTVWCLLLAVGITVLLSALMSAGSSTNANEAPRFTDQFHFVHQPLTGDGSITARVAGQSDSHEWAKAGIMIKERAEHEAPYAAVMVTPDHGVRFSADFAPDTAGSNSAAPRWLRLTRAGTEVTAAESADGVTWRDVGTVELDAMPQTVEVGMLVSSPSVLHIERRFGSTTANGQPTVGEATFDNVTLDSATGQRPGSWANDDIRPPSDQPSPLARELPAGTVTQAGGTFTVTGSGDVGYVAPGGDNDAVQSALGGIAIGMLALISLGVLFMTSEYKRGMIRTTFAVSPRRGRVLAAKAVVLGGTTFLAGLVASVAAFLVAAPLLRDNGFAPPAYPDLTLSNGTTLRAVIGTAGFLALLALFSLGVGAILRRSAGAITLVVALILVPQVVSNALPLEPAMWIQRVTPLAGLAIQQTRERYDTAIGPLAGFAVLCGYVVVALAAAFWLLRRRDA